MITSHGRDGLRAALWLTLGLLLLRVIYLMAINPYEIVADEAHYWDWARNLSWSYYTKGPGVAWTIWASTSLFGDAAWAIRLPAAISGAVMMLVLAKLAIDIYGHGRAGLVAAGLVVLCPPFFAVSQFMTIDAPFFACWAIASWLGWRMFRAMRQGEVDWLAWIGFGAVMGVGCLYKYTMLLLLPGLVMFVIWERRRMVWSNRYVAAKLACAGAFVVCVFPIVIWNQQHGWPTVAHLLGHLHMKGGDIQPDQGWSWNPLDTLAMVGGQLGIVGIPLWVLMGMSLWQVFKGRHPGDSLPEADAVESSQADVPGAERYLLSVGLPVWVMYFFVSFRTDVEPNWPVAAYVTWLVLVAGRLPGAMDFYKARVSAWLALPKPRPWSGWLRDKPETAWQVAWHWAIGWGVVGGIGIMLAGYVVLLPLNIPPALQRGLDRATGVSKIADEVELARETFEELTGEKPILIADNYQRASLLAYYLPDQPVVYSASPYMGNRVTSYDFFDATDLSDPALRGRDALLIGGRVSSWRAGLKFDAIKRDSISRDRDPKVFIALDYQGPVEP